LAHVPGLLRDRRRFLGSGIDQLCRRNPYKRQPSTEIRRLVGRCCRRRRGSRRALLQRIWRDGGCCNRLLFSVNGPPMCAGGGNPSYHDDCYSNREPQASPSRLDALLASHLKHAAASVNLPTVDQTVRHAHPRKRRMRKTSEDGRLSQSWPSGTPPFPLGIPGPAVREGYSLAALYARRRRRVAWRRHATLRAESIASGRLGGHPPSAPFSWLCCPLFGPRAMAMLCTLCSQ
jgi:hypothetical protein